MSNGLHRELALAYDPELRGLIRGGRDKSAIRFAGDFDYMRECSYHKQYDTKSWKSRCRKQHRGEKHFHTALEKENSELAEAERGTKDIFEIARTHSGWVKIDIRDNDEWEEGIDPLLKQKRVECLGNWWRCLCCPVRTIRMILRAPPEMSGELRDLAFDFFCFRQRAWCWTKKYRSCDEPRQSILGEKWMQVGANEIKAKLHGEYRRKGKLSKYSDSNLRSLFEPSKERFPIRKRYSTHRKKLA